MRELQGYNFAGVNSKGKDTSVQVAPANSLWAAVGLPLKTPFLDLLSRNYDGGVYRTDFAHEPEVCRQAINGWVEDKTKTRIKDLLQAGDITDRTTLVLVNALYLYANWQKEFEHESTSDAPFTTLSGQDVTVSMMHQVAQLPHVATDSFDAVEVPYVDGNLHLTLVLPKAGQFESVRASISGDWLEGVRGGLKVTPATLGLPKFKVETAQIDLKQSLDDLGFFDGGGGITGIAEAPVEISKVVQKAFISADERGTEAAAATAVVFEVSAPLPPEVEVVFNRPFLFFIQAESGIVLFSGQVVDPTK
jgi:serpin B